MTDRDMTIIDRDGAEPQPAARPWRHLVGTRRDWRLVRPARPTLGRPSRTWIGPALVIITVFGSWPAFAGTAGEDGDVSFALYAGSCSIMSMAWSFVLALRWRLFEPLFGGLDRMYRVHRSLAVVVLAGMWLHTQQVDELLAGIRGASRDTADAAEDLAGLAETLLYILIGISVLRMLPWRIWRLGHKLLGIPFLFASWHFFTAEKPHANTSIWGWWFTIAMLTGAVAWLWRVIVLDMVRRGTPYTLTSVVHTPGTTTLELTPAGSRGIRHRAGQFAFVKLLGPGLAEPHPFSIASSPDETALRFHVRDLGDWTMRMREGAQVGDRVMVDGPYGRFMPLPSQPRATVWIAGGIGITPFISAAQETPAGAAHPPDLFYAARCEADAIGLDELRRADDEGRIRLHVHASADANRLTEQTLHDHFGDGGLAGAYVAICGPDRLIHDMVHAARSLGATDVHHEDFDLRSGVGPDLSRHLALLNLGRFGRRTEVPSSG
ncbi:MAG: ferric reductase-like transmembrane domain-containing protein [Ilumatobacteraceae bacterium]